MKESMMRRLASVCIQMNKLILILPLFFITMCGEAPVTPPAGACSLPLDGSSANCPPHDVVCLSLDCPPIPKPITKPTLPRKELKGEVDIWNVNQIHQMQFLFLENKRIEQAENNLTQPSDAINNALEEFWEVQDGSDGSTEQEELL